MECIVCNKPIGKKARYCSDKCKQEAYRNRKQAPAVTSVTPAPVTDLELCRYCSKPLPPLAKPRRNPGACYGCAIKQPRRPSIDGLGDTVYAGSEAPPITQAEVKAQAEQGMRATRTH